MNASTSDLDGLVQLTFADNDYASYISGLGGSDEIVDDVKLENELWQDSLERWFENGPEDTCHADQDRCLQIQTWGRMGDHVPE